ncbi:MAG: hypothetical protein ACTHNS_13590 [Marmoricola sp.]
MLTRVAWLLVALVLVSGCGTRPTGHGAPPYQEPSSAAPVALRTSYPAVRLKVTLPPMAGEDENAVRAYIRFTVETLHTWASGKATAALGRFARPGMRRLVVRLIPPERAYGRLDEPTVIAIRQVSTRGALSSLRTCVRHAGKASSTGTLMVLDARGRWRASATEGLARPLKNCGG